MGRHALHEQGRDLPLVQIVREMEKLVGRVVAHLRIAPQRRDAIGDAVAGLKPGDTLARALDNADALETDNNGARRHRPGMGDPAAMVGVREVDAHSRVAQPDLARPGVRHRPVLPCHDIRGPKLVYYLGF